MADTDEGQLVSIAATDGREEQLRHAAETGSFGNDRDRQRSRTAIGRQL
jgi:hypothetical protein